MRSLADEPDARCSRAGAPELLTYYTEGGVQVCNNCCSSSPSAPNWTDGTTTGPGMQTVTTSYVDCGSATNSCYPGGTQSNACVPQSYVEYNDDPEDCCVPAGYPSNAGCCNGLVALSNGTCGSCVSDGGSCGADGDCCNADCNSGTCGPGCAVRGEGCYDDSDCCSDFCDPSEGWRCNDEY